MQPYSLLNVSSGNSTLDNSTSTGTLSWLTQPYQLNSSGTLPGTTNINIGNNMSINGATGTISVGPSSSSGSTTANTIVLDGNNDYMTVADPATGVRQIVIGKLPDGTYGMVVSKPGIDVLSLFS